VTTSPVRMRRRRRRMWRCRASIIAGPKAT
jgi:hypothetical protein